MWITWDLYFLGQGFQNKKVMEPEGERGGKPERLIKAAVFTVRSSRVSPEDSVLAP